MPKDQDVACHGRMDLGDPLVLGDPIPISGRRDVARPGRAGDDRDDDLRTGQGQPSSGDEPVPAVVAGAAQDDDGPRAPTTGVDRQGLDSRRHGRSGMFHQPFLGDAQGLCPKVCAGHRLRADR